MRTPLSIKEMNLLLNRELTEANTVLDKFVYSCSHDLKGPLASIKGLIRLAEKSSRNDITDECLHLINESVERMDTFIKSLESFVSNARGPVLKNEVDLLGIINRIMESRIDYAKTHKIKMRVRVKQMQKFFSDDARINIILYNLIDNAINYQDMKKTEKFVDIEVKVSARFAQVEVCDNGEGIAKDSLEDIFQMFYRSSEASRGSGLGLYIVQEALLKLGGEISVASSKGVGTNFVVRIPNHIKS